MQLQAAHVVRAKQVQERCSSLENFLDTDRWLAKADNCMLAADCSCRYVLQSNAIVLLPSKKVFLPTATIRSVSKLFSMRVILTVRAPRPCFHYPGDVSGYPEL